MRHRHSGEDLVVFMHGLGCAKESFDSAFSAPALAPYSLLTFDFPEHGDSVKTGAGDIDGVAEVVSSLLREVPCRRVHLVCHSMGGAIGLLVAQDLLNLADFVSVEGNLVRADCGLVSRGIKDQPVEQFVDEGFPSFVRLLETSGDPSHVQWARWYGQCSPPGLHSLATSLVEWCDNDKLVGILLNLNARTAYVRGEHSEVDHLKPLFGGADHHDEARPKIPAYSVTGSGHFPMLDNPAEFYGLIGELLDSTPSMVSPLQSV
ncbi:alpha/beta fold hydrolase [Actinoplanes sp. CA-054009]